MATETPTYLAVETHEGRANLAGKRRLLTDLDDAVEVASEIFGQLYALEPVEIVNITPISATVHVSLVNVPTLDPTRTPLVGVA